MMQEQYRHLATKADLQEMEDRLTAKFATKEDLHRLEEAFGRLENTVDSGFSDMRQQLAEIHRILNILLAERVGS